MNSRSAIHGTKEYARRLRERERQPQLTARVPKWLHDLVRDAALRRRESIAEVVRRTLDARLRRRDGRSLFSVPVWPYRRKPCRSKTT